MTTFKTVFTAAAVLAGTLLLPGVSHAGYASTICSSGMGTIGDQVGVYLENPVPQNALYVNIALEDYPVACPKYKQEVGEQVARLTEKADSALTTFASAPSKEAVASVIAAVSELQPFNALAIYDHQVDKVKLALANFTDRDLSTAEIQLLNPATLPSGERSVIAAFGESYAVASAKKVNIKINIASNQTYKKADLES